MCYRLAQGIHPDCLHTTLAGYEQKIHQNQIRGNTATTHFCDK